MQSGKPQNESFERAVRRILLAAVGIVFLFVGFFTFWLPIPIGLVLMVVGLALLLVSSALVRGWVRALRRRYPGFDERLNRVTKNLPQPFRRALRHTEIRGRRRALKPQKS